MDHSNRIALLPRRLEHHLEWFVCCDSPNMSATRLIGLPEMLDELL
jgi:hypothetical protein